MFITHVALGQLTYLPMRWKQFVSLEDYFSASTPPYVTVCDGTLGALDWLPPLPRSDSGKISKQT